MKQLFYILLVLLLISCKESGKGGDADVVRPVKVALVESGNQITKSYAGSVSAQKSTNLAFRVNGQIIKIDVREGEVVQRNQVLAVIDNRDLLLTQQAKQSAYVTAKAQYERFERLYAQQAVSKQDLETARTRFELAQVDLDIATNMLDDAKLRAPFKGTIEKSFADAYQRISYGEPIVRLVNTDSLYISFLVADNNLSDLVEADVEFWVRFNIANTPYYKCKLREYVDISVGGGGIPVSLWIDDPEFTSSNVEIKPGIACEVKVEFIFNNQPSWTRVPITAVFIDPTTQKESVWVMQSNGTLSKHAVKVVGLSGTDNYIISEGLQVGDTIVTAGAFNLFEGQRVKIMEL